MVQDLQSEKKHDVLLVSIKSTNVLARDLSVCSPHQECLDSDHLLAVEPSVAAGDVTGVALVKVADGDLSDPCLFHMLSVRERERGEEEEEEEEM